MARKYKRDSRGRFAGGSGGSSGGTGTKVSSGSGRKPAVAGQKRAIPAKGSAAMKKSNPSNQRLQRAKKVAKQAGKFAAKNPRLVIGVAMLAAANMPVGNSGTSGLKKAAMAMAKAQKFAEGRAADKRGIGGKPSAGLTRAKRNMRGAYKIRSS